MTKTYAQLAREIEALQASANKLLALEVQSAIASINQSIALYGLTADDLRFDGARSSSSPATVRQQAKSSPSSATSGLQNSDAKFSDGNGRVWSGRGPRPIWLRNALLQGRTLESFAVSGTGASGKASATTGTPVKSAGAKTVNKLPALFEHAKTGKTWSGRGPQPAWLKQGLKKRGATLDDFRIGKPEASSSAPVAPTVPISKPATAPVAPTKKSPAAKKTAAAKKAPVTKKVVATTAAPVTPAPAPAKKAAAKKAAAKKSAAPAKSPAASTAPADRTAPVSTSAGTRPDATTAAKKAPAAKKTTASKKVSVKSTPAQKSKTPPASAGGSSPIDDVPPQETGANASIVPAASPSPV